jgi:hypothetical protein
VPFVLGAPMKKVQRVNVQRWCRSFVPFREHPHFLLVIFPIARWCHLDEG